MRCCSIVTYAVFPDCSAKQAMIRCYCQEKKELREEAPKPGGHDNETGHDTLVFLCVDRASDPDRDGWPDKADVSCQMKDGKTGVYVQNAVGRAGFPGPSHDGN